MAKDPLPIDPDLPEELRQLMEKRELDDRRVEERRSGVHQPNTGEESDSHLGANDRRKSREQREKSRRHDES